MNNTAKCNDFLNEWFDNEKVLTANIRVLKQLLQAAHEMINSEILNEKNKERTPKRIEMLKLLIEMKEREESFLRTHRIALGTLCVSILVLVLNCFSAWRQLKNEAKAEKGIEKVIQMLQRTGPASVIPN